MDVQHSKYANRKSHTTIDVKYLDKPDTRPVKFKHKFLNWVFHRPWAIGLGLDVVEAAIKEKIPGFGKGKKNFFKNPETNYFFHLPTPVDIKSTNIQLPREVAREMVRRADHRIIMDKCVCREARDCKRFNHDISCIVLGDIGKDFVPPFSHLISAEEAFKHIDRGIAAGLVPTVARTKIDNFVFETPDKWQMGGICFCCDCCCAIPQAYGKIPADEMKPLFYNMPGLEHEVTDACTGCGTCLKTCGFGAMVIRDGRAYINDQRCTACGRCVLACPQKAVKMTMTDPDAVKKITEKILSLANLKSQS